jgi:biotin transport system substrate-specific component
MSQAVASKSLVSLTLPQSGVARWAAQLFLVISGTLLLAISAKTKVVLGPVDLSLQSLVVLLIAASFGLRLGVATLIAYLFEGAMGLPVFQGTPEKGIGLFYMMGPTGGFLVGFVLMTAVVGWAADRGFDRGALRLLPTMLVADAAMMVLGFAWLALLIGPEKSWEFGVAPFILPELVKVGIAACFVPAVWGLARAFVKSKK